MIISLSLPLCSFILPLIHFLHSYCGDLPKIQIILCHFADHYDGHSKFSPQKIFYLSLLPQEIERKIDCISPISFLPGPKQANTFLSCCISFFFICSFNWSFLQVLSCPSFLCPLKNKWYFPPHCCRPKDALLGHGSFPLVQSIVLYKVLSLHFPQLHLCRCHLFPSEVPTDTFPHCQFDGNFKFLP